jgi:cobalt-zinc-cadmium resistance protein CzcA
LENFADRNTAVLRGVRGIEGVNVFRGIGLPELQIQLYESRMAYYAISKTNAQAVIEMAICDKAATRFYEGERTFDISVRFQKEYRDDEIKIGN